MSQLIRILDLIHGYVLIVITLIKCYNYVQKGGIKFMLDQRGCRIINAIAKKRSFSKAAASIYISQPSLSRYVRTLEATLGIKLFDRSTIPLTITPAGKIVLAYINKFQKLDKQMQKDLKTFNIHSAHTLKIDSLPRLAIYLLPKIIPHFAQMYPTVDLQIKELQRTEGILNIQNDASDIFLTNRESQNPHYESVTLQSDPILLVANYSQTLQKIYPDVHTSPTSPLPIDWRLFSHSTMILLESYQNMRYAADKVCRHFGITPAKIIQVSSLPAAVSLVCANKGISFICNSAMGGITVTAPLIYFSLGDIQHITDIRAIYKKGNPNAYIPIFCHMAKRLLFKSSS